MANLTLSVDEKMMERARTAAQAMGTSLNQLVRDQIERLSQADQSCKCLRTSERAIISDRDRKVYHSTT